MKRNQNIKRHIIQLGTLILIVVAAALIVPPLLGKVAARGPTDRIVLQFGNSTALHNGESIQITEDNGSELAPYQEDGIAMLPVRWFAEETGFTATWDALSKIVILTDEENKKTQVRLPIGSTEMQVGDTPVALDVSALIRGGVTYVPVRALSEALGWNVTNSAAADSYIFLDNGSEIQEATAEQIAEARKKLGPSREELLAGGLVARAGSGTLIWNGSHLELLTDSKKHQGTIQENNINYLPLETTMTAIGGTATLNGGEYTLTLGERSFVIREEETAEQTLEDVGTGLYTDQDGVIYISAEKLASALSLQYSSPSDSVFALTVDKLVGYTSQEAYIATIGSQLPDKVADIPNAKGYIALTFDDGPTGGKNGLTARLLDGLKERDAHATFFMCGYRVKDFHTHMQRYLTEGHELGNHTMDHPLKFSKLLPEKIYDQVDSNSTLIASYTGQKPTVMRPVGGAVTENVKVQMKKLGLPIINWSVDTQDWKYRDATRVKSVIVNQARDGDIVLMHDLYETTVKGVLAAIDDLQKQGYAFVTVQELAQVRDVTLVPGEVYTHIGE